MILIYIIGTFLISIALFFNRITAVRKSLVILFLILQWVFTYYEFTHKGITEFNYFKPDALAILLLFTVSIISIPALLHTYDYIYKDRDNRNVRKIYYIAMIILVMALSAAYVSSHIAVTWIFVEITTLSAATLIFHRRNAGSIEATWKYIFASSISLTFVFIGILFLSIALNSSNDDSLHYDTLISLAHTFDTFWLRLAFIFIFVGYTVKLGLVPMYTAGIDAKDKAPTPSAALFSSVLMNVGFVGFFRFYEIIAQTSLHSWANHVLMIAAFLSIFVATVYVLKVKNIKRMLAYSSIEHMGIIMLGIAAGGIGYYAAILHIILHSFAKSAAFLQIGHLYKVYQTKNIYFMGNYFKFNLAGAIFLFFVFICITAMPPSGMFVSEFFIFKSLFDANYIYVLIPVLIMLTFIIWILAKNIFKILFISPVDFDETKIQKINSFEIISQFVLIALVFYLGLNPPAFFDGLIHEAIQNLKF